MKKLLAFLAAATVAVCVVAFLGVYLSNPSHDNNQPSVPVTPTPTASPSATPQPSTPTPTPTPANEVKVTDVTSVSGWNNYVGTGMFYDFNITVYNGGSTDISGLALEANIPGVSEDIYTCSLSSPVIHPGESAVLGGHFATNLENLSKISGCTAEFKLVMDDKVLDQFNWTLPS